MIKNFYHPELLQTPDGVRDIYGRECELKNHIQDKIHSIIKSYGFDDIQTPSFEFFDIFNKERGTVKSNEMYKFVDRNNNTLVLRPDITPSIARSVSKYYENEKLQVRLCYVGNTYINNSNYQGRLKEVTQAGAELINDDTSDADAEIIALTIEALLETGITEFRIDVGHVGFFNGLVAEAGLADEQINELKDLLERKNLFAVEQFVAGLPIKDSVKEMLIRLPEMFGSDEYLAYAKKNVKNERSLAAIDRLEKLYSIIDVYGLRQYVNFDLGMLSNYNYYTGTIFRAYTYGLGEPIATGGRYDSLLKQFGKDGAAIGVAINVDQLMLAIERKNLHPEPKNNSCIILYSPEHRQKA
ncbi:MAG: ATP phosphoribosyltransferase regulatory subunit, partial [Lachnospiraceae bacterium]|nr:ATP phosphoribosyltransferase regulatory subunit [Lachnospiraceae bacterium]